MSFCESGGGTLRRIREFPAFVVLHDSALEDLCLVEPSNLQELRRVSGFGDKKVQMYGKQILEAIQKFRQGQRADSSWRAKTFPASRGNPQVAGRGAHV